MRGAAIIVLAIGVAGCAEGAGGSGGGATVFDVRRISHVNTGMVSGTGDSNRIVVLGGDAASTAAQVRLPNSAGGGGFMPVAPEEGGSRLVFSFAPMSAEALCQDTSPSGAGAGSGEASTAWCFNDSAIAYARGRSPALSSPDAPGFSGAAQQMISAMLRERRPVGRR